MPKIAMVIVYTCRQCPHYIKRMIQCGLTGKFIENSKQIDPDCKLDDIPRMQAPGPGGGDNAND